MTVLDYPDGTNIIIRVLLRGRQEDQKKDMATQAEVRARGTGIKE